MKPLREPPVATTVGDSYRLVRRIGEGGQGTVFEARQRRGPRSKDGDARCAVKVLTGGLADDAEALARFQTQAEIASQINHPNLVRVLDFGTSPTGEPFLVMEYLEGEDLGRLLRRVGRMEPMLVAHVVKQVAAGLVAAAQQGLLHRNLKPSNIFLLTGYEDGDPAAVKVLDCGTAQILNARTLNDDLALEETLPYVSPEQASGGAEPVDQRSDQWSLACIAWHMLTGNRPFAGSDATALLYQISFEDPLPMADQAIGIPPGVMMVLTQALAKRPENRYAELTAFAALLEEAAGGPLPRKAPRKSAKKMKAAEAQRQAAAEAPAGKAEAHGGPPGATLLGMPEPVFLPGMTRRQSEPQRRTSRTVPGAQTRLQGLRVRSATEMPAVTGGSAPTESPSRTSLAHASVMSSSTGDGLRARLAAMRPRSRLLLGALPVAAAIALVASWSLSGSKAPPDVERATSPTPASPAKSPSSATKTASTGGGRPSGRPTFEPLAPRATRAAKDSRRRGRGLRARRAAKAAEARAQSGSTAGQDARPQARQKVRRSRARRR